MREQMRKTKSIAKFCSVSKEETMQNINKSLTECKEQLNTYCLNQRLKHKRFFFIPIEEVMRILAYGEPGLEGDDYREFNQAKTFKILY